MAENEVSQVVVEPEKIELVVVEPEKIELVIESAPVAPLALIESAPVAPLTREELTKKMEELSVRARAAGMSPLQTMIATYAKRGMTMIEVFLSALEDGSSTKKPSAIEAKAPADAKEEG